MMKVFLLALLLPFSCVQQEYHPEKIWLFSKVQYAGNIPSDRNGKHFQIHPVKVICYLKISRKINSPDWERAIIDGKHYNVEAERLNGDSVAVGELKDTNSPVIIKVGPDSKLLRLTLTLPGKIEKPEAWSFLLYGILNEKYVFMRSNAPMVELSPDMMP